MRALFSDERDMLRSTFADLASRSASGKTIDKETFLKSAKWARRGGGGQQGNDQCVCACVRLFLCSCVRA